jgi:hypothetical protein
VAGQPKVTPFLSAETQSPIDRSADSNDLRVMYTATLLIKPPQPCFKVGHHQRDTLPATGGLHGKARRRCARTIAGGVKRGQTISEELTVGRVVTMEISEAATRRAEVDRATGK